MIVAINPFWPDRKNGIKWRLPGKMPQRANLSIILGPLAA
jgi:hypothetical protein